MNYCYGKGVQKYVLCWKVVPFLEGSFIRGSTITGWVGPSLAPLTHRLEHIMAEVVEDDN